MRKFGYVFLTFTLAVPNILCAQSVDDPNVGSVGSFGGIGLLEMRNARFGNDGDLYIGGGYFEDGRNYYATWQATPWLETTLRFSDYDEALQGVDKAIDVKLRLAEEGQYRPSLAIGLQDLLGDGVFSGEYIVATKRIHDFDVTMGLGFGNLAGRAKIYNVARVFGSGFENRDFNNPGSEKLRFSDYFSGENMGFYWGVEYKTPVKGLTTKVEFSTLNKSEIELFQDYESKTALNFGANYKIKNWLEIGGGLLHGNQLAFHISLRQNLHNPSKLTVAKGPEVDAIRIRELRNTAVHSNDYKDASDDDIVFERFALLGYSIANFSLSDGHITVHLSDSMHNEDDGPIVLGALLEQYSAATVYFDGREVSAMQTDEAGVAAVSAFRESSIYARENITEDNRPESIEASISKRMLNRKLAPIAITVSNGEVYVDKEVGPFGDIPKNIGRTVRVLTNEAPDDVERFTITSKEQGVKVSKISVLRKDFERLANYNSSPEEIWANARIHDPADEGIENKQNSSFQRFQFGVLPDVITHFGSEKDDHFKGELNLKIFGKINLTEKLQLYAEGKQHIIGNLDQIPGSINPNVPQVRSDIARYAAEGTTSIRRLSLEYIESPLSNFYTRLTAGHLEAMYSGISGELLYRPYDSSFAFGADINVVKQRGFDQLFDMRDYETVTGHVSAYYTNKKYDLTTKVSVGRYLARDWGTTIEIYRQFKNGIRIGAVATFTDMTEGDFGSGSFDKGVYMTIPFDFFWFKQSREKAKFNFRRLGKNGGQKLNHKTDLFDMLSDGQPTRIQNNWNKILE